MRAWEKQKGFTIVELLIVIVVIAILAAITIVSYNGIQAQARVSIAKADLKALAQQMELFKVKHDEYPESDNSANYSELETIIKAANLYKVTRHTDLAVPPERSFVFCRYPANDAFTIIAVAPLLTDIVESTAGADLYYVSSTDGLQQTTLKWDNSITASGVSARNLCKSADPDYDAQTYGGVWSYHVPTSYAP